jgi:hypothetical protein
MSDDKPKTTSWGAREAATTAAAQAIIDAEAAEREAKTERLRAARQARENEQALPMPTRKPAKAAKPRRARTST